MKEIFKCSYYKNQRMWVRKIIMEKMAGNSWEESKWEKRV